MDTKRIIGVLLAVVLTTSMASAVTLYNVNMLWEGTVVNNAADRLDYRNDTASYTWTLNEDAFGNPADVTYAGAQCNIGYYTGGTDPRTFTVTIQTTNGDPGVLNYVGDANWSIRLGHLEDTGIINIENGNTLMVNELYKYANIDPTIITPISYAIVNINNGHLFSYGTPGDQVMSGVTVNIAEGSSLRLRGEFANVYDQTTYTAHTVGARDGLGGVVNAVGGATLQFTDGGLYEGNPTVLISAVPEPATLVLLGLGSLGMFWKKR